MEDARRLQLRFEKSQGVLGAARIRGSLELDSATTGAASTILARAVDEAGHALREYLRQKGSGRRPGCDEILKAVEPEEAAHIALRTTFERIVDAPSNRKRGGRPPSIQNVSARVVAIDFTGIDMMFDVSVKSYPQ